MPGSVVGLHANPMGGVPKHAVPTLQITKTGCVGDQQNDRRHHGGPLKAVCLMERSVMVALQAAGHPIGPGTTGENLLLDGLDEVTLSTGTELHVGHVHLRITGDAPPCKTIRESFVDGSFISLSHKHQPGFTRWYAEVLVEGTVALGDPVRPVSAGEPVGNP